ncbi:MarR family winged helix-turn-helix transcriptional regulator [Streptomyces sp. NPDC002755]
MSKLLHEDELAAQWHDVMGVYHRVTCALDRVLIDQHGVSVSEFEVLQQLHASDQTGVSVRMSELHDAVHLSQSALSRLVSRLEGAGLVQRATCYKDRRSTYVSITSDGARRFTEARPTQRSALQELLTPASGH